MRQFSAIDGENTFFCKQRVPVHWGEFSLVQATLMMIREALEHPTHYDYFVLLSGSDYPLRNGEYIRAFFEDNTGLEFMNLMKLPAPGFPIAKINKLRYPSDKPVRRFATRALGRLGLAQRDFKQWLRGLQPYCGSQWWAISRDAVKYIVEFTQVNPHVEGYFQNTFTSDEMFFHTILGNSPFRSKIRRNLVYLDWPKPREHPLILTDEHLRLFESLEKVYVEDEWGHGEALFARKFSDDNLNLLDKIDEMILRKERQIATSLPFNA